MVNKMLINPAPMLSSKPPAKGAPRSKKMIERITLTRPKDTAEIRSRLENIAIKEKIKIVSKKMKSIIMGFHVSRLNEISLAAS